LPHVKQQAVPQKKYPTKEAITKQIFILKTALIDQ